MTRDGNSELSASDADFDTATQLSGFDDGSRVQHEMADAERFRDVEKKRSLPDDLIDASEETTDSMTTTMNITDFADKAKPAAKRTLSDHRVVAMETPTSISGETRSTTDHSMRGTNVAAGTDREDTGADSRHGRDAAADPELEKQSVQNQHQSASDQLHSRDATVTQQSVADESSFHPAHGDQDSTNVVETRTRLNSGQAEKTSNVTFLSRRTQNSSVSTCPYVDRSEAISVTPPVGKIRVENPSLIHLSNSPSIVNGDRIPQQTSEKFPDRQTSRENQDAAHVVEMDCVEETENRTYIRKVTGQPQVVRIPVVSSEATAPARQFTVQREVKINGSHGRSLSTGSSNDEVVSGNGVSMRVKPVQAFIMPKVGPGSASDHNNNDLSTARRASAPHVVSDGRKSDITNSIPRCSVIDSNKYKSWQVVDISVHHALSNDQLPGKTGGGNSFDRKQNGHSSVNGRRNENAEDLIVASDTQPNVDDGSLLSVQNRTAGPAVVNSSKVELVFNPVPCHLTCSVPDLRSTSHGGKEESSHSDVTASSHGCDVTNNVDEVTGDVTQLTLEPLDVRRVGIVESPSVRDDLCRSDVIRASSQRCDVTKNGDDLTLQAADQRRVGVTTETESVRWRGQDNGGRRLSYQSTVQSQSGSGDSRPQQVTTRRRPRRTRTACLTHSSTDLSIPTDTILSTYITSSPAMQ